MTSLNPPKVSPPSTITLGGKVSTHEFCEGHILPIAGGALVLFLSLGGSLQFVITETVSSGFFPTCPLPS